MKAAAFGRSLTFRVTIAYLLSLIAIALLLLGAAYWFSVQRPLDRTKEALRVEVQAARAAHASEGLDGALRLLRARSGRRNAAKAFHALLGPDGGVIASNLPSWPMRQSDGWRRLEADLYRDGDEDDHEALVLDLTLPDGHRLIIGRDIEAISDREEMIQEAALWGSIALLLLGLPGGLSISWIIGARLERVRRTAHKVMEGELNRRIEVVGSNDDFDRLAATLNAMLDRIEELVVSVSRVSDSIAHELRSPLARLRTELEELSIEAADGRQQALVAEAVAEAERLQRTFDALLRIARIEVGRHELTGDKIDVEPLLADAIDLYEPAAAAKGQTIVLKIDPGLSVQGDVNLLFQATTNLIDNAIKFAPLGGRVRVSGTLEGAQPLISVRNNGRAPDARDLPRLTERFYRAPGNEGVEGIGLGLSLVAAVARAHGAQLALDTSEAGFEARLIFPAVTSPKRRS